MILQRTDHRRRKSRELRRWKSPMQIKAVAMTHMNMQAKRMKMRSLRSLLVRRHLQLRRKKMLTWRRRKKMPAMSSRKKRKKKARANKCLPSLVTASSRSMPKIKSSLHWNKPQRLSIIARRMISWKSKSKTWLQTSSWTNSCLPWRRPTPRRLRASTCQIKFKLLHRNQPTISSSKPDWKPIKSARRQCRSSLTNYTRSVKMIKHRFWSLNRCLQTSNSKRVIRWKSSKSR